LDSPGESAGHQLNEGVAIVDKAVKIVGVPLDLGQSRRGVDMGPSALRYAGLDDHLRQIGCRVRDCGNIEIPVRDELPAEGGMAFLPAVVEACTAVYEAGLEAIADGEIPVFLGGDHSIALGTVAAATERGPAGLLWIDAHGDFNTPSTSPTGNLHGMPLAALTGQGSSQLVDIGRPGPKVSAEDVVLVGLRSLDFAERSLLRASGITVFTMREIDEQGIGQVANQAIRSLAHLAKIHVSLDMDSLDPTEAPGVGTPVPGGLTYREAHVLLELVAASANVGSVDVVEINPILDHQNRTARIGVELVASLLGQTIY
jgi:arginase